MYTSLLSRHKKKQFLNQIIIGDEKWIYYDNPKHKKSWINPGQPSTSTSKRNIHRSKVLLCISEVHERRRVLWAAETKSNNHCWATCYQQQLIDLNRSLNQKRSNNRSKRTQSDFALHDNARPHVAKTVKDTLTAFQWEILSHVAYSPDCAPSDYYWF